MQPVSNYIQITPIPEPEGLVTEKKQLIPVLVKSISPDIEVPFKEGAEIIIVNGKQVFTNGGLFIHVDNAFLYK